MHLEVASDIFFYSQNKLLLMVANPGYSDSAVGKVSAIASIIITPFLIRRVSLHLPRNNLRRGSIFTRFD
jgi:hypothetical protein